MAIRSTDGMVSDEELDAMDEIDNPPENEPGFDEEGGSDDGSDGEFGEDIFGETDNSAFDGLPDENGMNMTGDLSMGPGTQAAAPQTPTLSMQIYDAVIQNVKETSPEVAKYVKALVKSIRTRTNDDWGDLGTLYAKCGIGVALFGIIVCIIFGTAGVPGFGLTQMPARTMVGGLAVMIIGMFIIVLAALAINCGYNPERHSLTEIGETVGSNMSFDEAEYNTDEVDPEALDDILSELSEDSGFEDEEELSDEDMDDADAFDAEDLYDSPDDYTEEPEEEDEVPGESLTDRYSRLEQNVAEDQRVITRAQLVELFKPFLETCTPDFSDVVEYERGSKEFKQMKLVITKAIARAQGKDWKTISIELVSVQITLFCYDIRVRRGEKTLNIDNIKAELESYFRDGMDDASVNAVVGIEGDDYRMVLTTGKKAIVTLGDCLKNPEVDAFFKNTKNRMPVICGIDVYGKPMLDDAKLYDQMMIVGKPRSGKSWYVFAMLLQMMMFNTPEDVQFIIIDPKKTPLFYDVGTLPHVCGVQSDDNIIEVMKDLIEKEGERRKAIQAANNCNDIWALRDLGIKVPVLYLVIDEVMTVLGNLKERGQDKEFNVLLNTILTQLPFIGIRIMIVPHRAQGVIEKTTRSLLSFKVAVRAELDAIKETLCTNSFDYVLNNPGDLALSSSKYEKPTYAHGLAISTSDNDLSKFIIQMARLLYKIGVDIPDMKQVGKGHNRDEEAVMKRISNPGEEKIVHLQKTLDSIDAESGIKKNNNALLEDDDDMDVTMETEEVAGDIEDEGDEFDEELLSEDFADSLDTWN